MLPAVLRLVAGSGLAASRPRRSNSCRCWATTPLPQRYLRWSVLLKDKPWTCDPSLNTGQWRPIPSQVDTEQGIYHQVDGPSRSMQTDQASGTGSIFSKECNDALLDHLRQRVIFISCASSPSSFRALHLHLCFTNSENEHDPDTE